MHGELNDLFRNAESIGESRYSQLWKAEYADGSGIAAVRVFPPGSMFLRPELLALARARHPNLADIQLVASTAAGESIVASQWVAGSSLTTARPSPDELVTIAAQVLSGLSELHARRLVHGRVRPSTIIVAGDDARVVDFATTEPGGGSVYAAPELTRSADPRSDLYSLGVVLFRKLTGAAPFDDSAVARLAQAKLGQPPDVRERAPSAPEGLVELVSRLLAPNPGDRPATAKHALHILGVSGSSCRTVTESPVFGAHLVGRDGQIAALEEMWWDAKAGRGGVALLSGPRGSGKTRLLDEICERATRSAGPVIRLEVETSSVWALAPPKTADINARFARHEALVGHFAKLADGEPRIIAVDDAHLADASRADLLAYLARASGAGNQLVVLTSVPPSGRGDDPALQLREAVLRIERGRVFELGDVGEKAISEALRHAIGAQLAGERSAQAFAEHGGRFGRIARVVGHRSPQLALEHMSPTSREAISRLSVLAPELDTALAAALLRGDEESVAEVAADGIEAGILRGAGGADRVAFSPESAAACARYLPAETAAELRVRTAELFADTAAEPERVARHYFAAGRDEPATEWGLRAAEALAARADHMGALDWYRRVLVVLDGPRAAAVRDRIADLCLLIEDFAGAVDQLESARDGTPVRPRAAVDNACRLARARLGLGDAPAALGAAMGALETARAEQLGDAEIEAHLAIATVMSESGDPQGALEHAVTGHLLATARGDRRAIAELLILRGDLESERVGPTAGIEKLEAATDAAAEIGDELLRARALHALGRASVRAGNYGAAVSALERATLFFERTAHVVQLARSLNNLGTALYYQGRWKQARSAWERFRRLCERADDRRQLVTALNNLGALYRDLGELSEALTVLDRGTEIAALRGDQKMSATLLGNRGETLVRRGDYAAGAECYTRALGEFERLGLTANAIETRRRLCELSLKTGRINDALDRVVDIARDARDAGTVLEEGILHRVAATALRQQGDLESAQWFADRSESLLSPLGTRYELAKLEAEQSALCAARGDRSSADAKLRAAMAVFEELGAAWDVSRCRAQLRGLTPQSGGELGATALLNELANAPNRSGVDDLLAAGLDHVLEQTRFGRGFILLLDPDGRPQQRVRRTRSGNEEFDPGEAEFPGSIVKRVAATGESIAITDVDEADDDLGSSTSVVALGLRQVMCAPMATRGRVIGTVYIDNRGDVPIDDTAPGLPILEAFAAEASVVVENARLEAEVSRKTELMAMLAHEIRNPLAGILGFSELGVQSSEDKTRELFTRIRRDGQRMRRLVDNVLELARHDAGKIDWRFEAVDMAELIEEVVDSFRPSFEGKQLELVVDTGALSSSARASADRIAQVLSNLISNAIKFTPEGGKISISARVESVKPDDPDAPPLPATNIEAWGPVAPLEAAGLEYVRVDISDTGPGMSEELRANLFQKFRQGARGKKSGKGVGLGLYISREIIVRHGGSIWANSVRGEGSTFSFRVPVAG